MATIHIDGRAFEVDGEQNLLHVALQLGFDLPYFCWHPAMGSVGACRQCAVKQFRDENDDKGQIVMACMTQAREGTRISISDPEATAFRAQVIEWLMLNHPHDCPVCDEGGECHLQDMTVMTGHAYRRTRFPKRTHRNQYLGPLINHEMNRCIQCYRCVRFYRDYAGGTDLDVLGAHDHVYFGRQEDGVLESPFAGNLVEVCPTGVFTDKTLKRHYTRKWDLQMAPSVCVHCGLGCNITVGERYGTLRRVVNRYNGHVNGYFLCDRGRYGYEFVNHPSRLREPRRREGGELRPTSAEEAVASAATLLRACDRVIGIGSPRASLEANFALRNLVGTESFFTGLSRREARLADTALSILRTGPAPAASLRDVERADAVLILGEDVGNTAPRLALSLRQAVRNRPMRGVGKLGVQHWNDHAVREATHGQYGPFFIATPDCSSLDDVATVALRAAPDDVARLGFAVAHAVDASAPAVTDLDQDSGELARRIAAALSEAERPLVVAGPSCGSETVLQAAANVAWALRRANHPVQLFFTAREADTTGVAMLGGGTLEDALEVLEQGGRVGVVALERDLAHALPSEAAAMLERAAALVVLDALRTDTVAHAHVALPAGTFAESDGTLVSSEGRAQRFFRASPPGDGVRESWRWLAALMEALGRGVEVPWRTLDDVLADLARQEPALAGTVEAAPGASARFVGGEIPRQPARYSGRTAMRANLDVNEPKPPDDADAPLSFSMEGYQGRPPSPLLPSFWAAGWNSIQAVNKFQEEIAGPLRGGDPGVRLLEPTGGAAPSYFSEVPAPFRNEKESWLVLPAYHVFGSEELSSLAPGIAELAPAPYLGVNPADAERLGVEPGAEVEVSLGKRTLRLPVAVHPALPDGVAVVPVGVADVQAAELPAFAAMKGAP